MPVPMPSVNTTDMGNPREPIRILQLNVHRSQKVMTSLFNSSSTRSFHFLLIQEPHINWSSHLSMTDPNWHMMAPLMNSTPTLTGDARIKSVIYVNNQLPSYSINPIPTDSPLISVILLALPLPHPPLNLISAYLPPGQAQEMAALATTLATTRTQPTIVGMDSNLHHSMCNPPNYAHTHREAEDLLTIMNNNGLLLRSEPRIPTFISNHQRGSQTTVDLQGGPPDCYDWATICRTDVAFEHSHFSDPRAIITEIDRTRLTGSATKPQ